MTEKITMNVSEMQEIMRQITSLILSLQYEVAPKLKTLTETTFYKGGEASKAMASHKQMLDKANEVGDLYANTNDLVLYSMMQQLAQDEQLGRDFWETLPPDDVLIQNFQSLQEKGYFGEEEEGGKSQKEEGDGK